MSFGVPYFRKPSAEREVMCDEKLLAAARSAAEGMVVDLERARQFTHDWANEKLTNAMVEAALSSCLHRLARTRCWGDANRIASHEFWRIAGPILEAGVLQCRARFKPRGYAGDYQMLQWIVEQYCCDHPLGRAFDRYFQCQAAPAAVRSRTEQIAASLVTQCLQAHAADFHVVSVGAGPASDIHSALTLLPEDHRGRVRLKLLDLDPDALQFARRHVEPLLSPGSLQCSRENLYRLPHVRHAEETLAAPDLLVCAGLFDYLEDDPAVEMLRLFWQRLAEGGLLLVGNFAPHNPTRAYMEWIGNWYLIYRTADDLEKLALQAGIPPEVFSIGSEKLGVDLFIMAQKPAAPRTPPGPSPAPG